MRNAMLDEAQPGIKKTAGRSINNLRYEDDTTLIPESKEKLKSLLMKVKVESEKAGLTLNIQNGIQSHHFMANRWGNNGNSDRFSWTPKSLQMASVATQLKDVCSLEEKL